MPSVGRSFNAIALAARPNWPLPSCPQLPSGLGYCEINAEASNVQVSLWPPKRRITTCFDVLHTFNLLDVVGRPQNRWHVFCMPSYNRPEGPSTGDGISLASQFKVGRTLRRVPRNLPTTRFNRGRVPALPGSFFFSGRCAAVDSFQSEAVPVRPTLRRWCPSSPPSVDCCVLTA